MKVSDLKDFPACINFWDQINLKKAFPDATLKQIETDFEIGKTYFCSYWHMYFTVLEIKSDRIFDKIYVSKWQDGKINSHSTKPDKRYDFEIVLNN